MKTRMLLLFVLFLIACPCLASAAGAPVLNVSQKNIEIGASFEGTNLKATGEIPEDSEVVLRFMGEYCDVPMKQKGKVFGVMWMNLDSLVIRKVPGVCMINTCAGLDKLAGEPDSDVKSLGLAGLGKGAEIECNGANHDTVMEEFLKLKEEEGLYREVAGNVIFATASGGMKSFEAQIPVPSRLSPGKYRLEMSVLKNGKITDRRSEEIDVSLVGFPGMLMKLAYGHAALYGILSTLIALIAGLGIGLVFQSKGAH